MKTENKVKAVKSVIKLKFLKRKIPIVVTWAVTNKCNYRCLYCDRWRWNGNDAPTEDILSVIDRLSELGCVRISFSGGEPLLREDIEIIINHCKQKGISSTIISNGYLIPERIKRLRNVDLIELSLDGPKEINDLIRGSGAFDRTLRAIKIIKDAGIKAIFNTVLTKYNLDYIDFMLDTCLRYNLKVMFGPVSHIHARDIDIGSLSPKQNEFNHAVGKLIHKKRDGAPIINSISVLKYMKDWPKPKRIPCYAGRAFCHITADGKLYPCVKMEGRYEAPCCLNDNFEEIFNNLLNDLPCDGCWCMGTLEFNRLLAFRPSAISTLERLS